VPNLALIALGDSHHSQGGMKFATQISPLLNFVKSYIVNTTNLKILLALILQNYIKEKEIVHVSTSSKAQKFYSIKPFLPKSRNFYC
jgi:hypothetical protein